jgi:hypothetical protein
VNYKIFNIIVLGVTQAKVSLFLKVTNVNVNVNLNVNVNVHVNINVNVNVNVYTVRFEPTTSWSWVQYLNH